jgi:ECF transporter, substrate-specific component
VRVFVGVVAGAIALVVGLDAIPSVDGVADPDGIVPTATRLTFVLVLGVVAALVAYAAVELVQTRRLDSIARQFSTRTIVLIPIAIAMNVVLGQTVGTALKLPLYLDSVGTILVGVLAGPIAGAATGILSNLTWTFLLGNTPFGSPFAWPFAIVAAEIGLVAGLFGYAGVFRPRPQTSLSRLIGGTALALALVGALVWFSILPFYRDLCPSTNGLGQVPGGFCFELFTPKGTTDPLFLALGTALLAFVALALVALVLRLARDRDLGVAYVLVAGAACGILSALIATPIATLVFGGVTGSGTDVLVAAFQQAGSELQQAVLQQSLISDPIDKALTFLLVFTILTAVSRRVAARFPQGERALGTIEV